MADRAKGMALVRNLVDLDISADVATIGYPSGFYPHGSLTECLKRAHRVLSWDLANQGARQTLRIRAKPDTVEDAVREVFAELHGYPCFFPSKTDRFRSNNSPLMSCIILLTANDLFVANHLIPSIIRNSKDHDIEILIVYNGLDANLNLFRRFDVSVSEFGCVSKGYNQGVNRSHGKYVAIFHDDCVLADANWIQKCISRLEDGYVAVSPEIRTSNFLGADEPFVVAKNVPLVIDRERFVLLGGYDERYYIGYEDFDLTYQILSGGADFSKVELDYIHFNGMSTTLMFGDKRPLHKSLFALDLLPMNAIFGLRDSSFQNLMRNEESVCIQRNEFCYFLSKFEQYWATIGYCGALDTCGRLAGEPGGPDHCPLVAKRQIMIDFVRRFAGRRGK
ncbi:MAG TPA: glycosyltransferase [Terriglobales bacterium]